MQPLKEVRYHKAEVLTQICKRINRHNPIIEKFGMGRNKSLSVRMKSHREPFSFISRTKMLFIGKWRSAAIGRFGRLALGGPANESSWLAAAATGQEKGSPNNKGEKQIRAFRSIPSAAEETLLRKSHQRSRWRASGELHCTEVASLLRTQRPRVRFLAFPKIYYDVAKIYRRCWLEETGQRIENVKRTHLVVASWYSKKASELQGNEQFFPGWMWIT